MPPYNTLPKATGDEKVFFLIVDKTQRIPEVHKILAREWGNKHGKLIEEKDFPGWKVSTFRSKE